DSIGLWGWRAICCRVSIDGRVRPFSMRWIAVRVSLPPATCASVSLASRRACSTEPARTATPLRRPRYLVPSMAVSVPPCPATVAYLTIMTLRGRADRSGERRRDREHQSHYRQQGGKNELAHSAPPRVMRRVSADLTG